VQIQNSFRTGEGRKDAGYAGLGTGALKMTDMKLQDKKMADKIAGHENARYLELCT